MYMNLNLKIGSIPREELFITTKLWIISERLENSRVTPFEYTMMS